MRRREKTLKVTKHLVLFIGAIIMLVPFAWMILTAFKTNTEESKLPDTSNDLSSSNST